MAHCRETSNRISRLHFLGGCYKKLTKPGLVWFVGFSCLGFLCCVLFLGTNLIHDFTAVTFSMKLAFFREKRPFPCFREIRDFFRKF